QVEPLVHQGQHFRDGAMVVRQVRHDDQHRLEAGLVESRPDGAAGTASIVVRHQPDVEIKGGGALLHRRDRVVRLGVVYEQHFAVYGAYGVPQPGQQWTDMRRFVVNGADNRQHGSRGYRTQPRPQKFQTSTNTFGPSVSGLSSRY